MSWKILVTASAVAKTGQHALELLRDAECEVLLPPKFGPLNADEILKLLSGMDAVLASLDRYSAGVLASEEAAQLKIISRWGIGYDAIDLWAATQNGIVVTYTPGMADDAVADYAFALLLALARRVHEGHATVRKGEWAVAWGSDLAGKTLGLLGCGHIGLAVARRAAGFNLRLLANDVAPHPEAVIAGVKYVSFDELLAESDFLSLHASLMPENRGLIGEEQLRRMKPTAYLINTARGALVDEDALVQALREGWIAGAALDVFCEEPLPAEHPLRFAPNVLLSPHQALFSIETGERISLASAQAILDLMNGRRPQHVLNPDVFKSSTVRAPIKR